MNTQPQIEAAGKAFPATTEQITAFQKLSEHMGEPVNMWLLMDRSGCIMFTYPNITIGIETDGYTHS